MGPVHTHLKYLFYLCGDRTKASSRVRGYWVASVLQEQGVACSFEHRHTRTALLRFALRIPFAHVVVFQKSYARWHCLLLRLANLLGKTTILDLDDAPSRTNHPVTLRNVEFMMRHASAVTVGSRVLLNYASRYSENVHLVPSCISLKYYQPGERRKGDKICLGWIGNGSHYKDDLIAILREPLAGLARKLPLRFKLIGACGERALYEAFQNIPGLEFDCIDQIEWSNPAAVVEALQDIDIGLYPLLPRQSNEYKCGFKALEYMAMRVPVVSSNVAENREIVEHGVNGYLAETPAEWSEALSRLITAETLRNQFGSAGRRKVEQQYSADLAARMLLDIAGGTGA